MASSYIKAQGAVLSATNKYAANSKIPLKNSFKMPSIHPAHHTLAHNATPSHIRDLSLGSENRVNTLPQHKRVSSTTNQKSYDESRDIKNGPPNKIKYKTIGENDPRPNKQSVLSNLIHDEDTKKFSHYLRMHYNDNKTETTRLINQKMKDSTAEHSSLMDKTGRARRKHLPPIIANPYPMEEANTPSSYQSNYQPSPSNIRKKTDPSETGSRVHSRKFDDFTPLRGSKKRSSPSPENFYRLEVPGPRNRLDIGNQS